ncbi:protein PFC0760c-like [Ostrinia furnacalis]|uniref:protein PFC0760c-like n=1 Tax=Ostrinia furnacalis TaxID=93504 RepID=UPI00103FB2AE|nr:protein PFC0760c-like [Ostrinia furnacalis]
MAMDAKDLRTETTIGECNNDGSSKFAQGSAAPPCSVSETYENISTNPLAKLEAPTSRPCAVIGPDRIVPPSNGDGAYSKKGHYDPWLHVDNTYHPPPEYPHKIPSYQSPIRNISPRQTFQENMQRIMVQPTYNSVKISDDANYPLDRNTNKNGKIPGPHEAKYCDVPYSVNAINSDQKSSEMCLSNMNNSRNYPQMWHPGGVGIRPPRPYGAPEIYQFPEYTSCAGPRQMPMPRTHRSANEDPSLAYGETYYSEGNIRYKPYPTVKDRYPQTRYEYVSNYANPFHPPPTFPSHKYDLQKPLPPHLSYPQVPIKYLENRMNETVMEGYQRPPLNYNVPPYRNQVIHSAYGPVIGSNLQNKVFPYPPDGSVKSLTTNKLPYDNKLYAEYENARNKGYPMSESMYFNEIARSHGKTQPILPNYPAASMQTIHAHPYYRKDNLAAKNFEYMSHFRHLDPSMNPNLLTRHTNQFSPTSIAISPSDSNTSNETAHTHGGSLEDCGYASQSSTASVRSFDSGLGRMIPNDFHRRYNYPYQTMVRASTLSSKPEGSGSATKDKKGIDVRQYLQMWNEGEEEHSGKEKEVVMQSDLLSSKLANQYEVMKNNEQLYVLGLVNVPSEELGKYEHIQKISKLPDNIKGYNNIELLKHFEEAIESSNVGHLNHKPPTPRNYQSMKSSLIQGAGMLPPRPLSPLDVEAKISQSVIHKEVGCNFEIKPCSPEMLNVEVATPAQSVLGEERVIEKVSNPMIANSPILSSTRENEKHCDMSQKEHRIMLNDNVKTQSCNMINTQCSNNEDVNVMKANYSLQDLESNAGVCLASLPRLDNDIELNFPEVNQQFINANKESVIIANDFPIEMDVMTNNDAYQTDEDFATKSENSSNVLPILESDKEVSKLSKYRKVKRNDTECKDKQTLSASQSLRTDSVIIKNPENTKCIEKNTETNDHCEMKTSDCLSVKHHMLNDEPVCHDSKEMDDDVTNDEEMAIDFSLSKNENNLDDKDSNYLCELYNTEKSNSPCSESNSVYQQLVEDTNKNCCNSPSVNSNDYTTKSPVSDEINDINAFPVSDSNDTKLHENDIKNNEDKEEYSKEISEILLDRDDKETESINTDNVSDINKINNTVHDHEIVQAKDTVDYEIDSLQNVESKIHSQMSTSTTKVIDDNDTILSTENISALKKKYRLNGENNHTNLFNEGRPHSLDNNNYNIENDEVHCESIAIEGTNTYDNKEYLERVSHNDTMESHDNYILVKKYLEVKVVKKSIHKELFSPRIQNLLLWSEGQNGLKSFITNPNVAVSTEDNLNIFNKLPIKDNPTSQSDKQNITVDNQIFITSYKQQPPSKDCPNPDLGVEDCTLDNLGSAMDSTDELQSESADLNDCPVPDSNMEISNVNNLISTIDPINTKLQSESTKPEDCSILDANTEVSAVENLNSVDDSSSTEIQPKCTDVKELKLDIKDCPVDNVRTVKDLSDNNLQTNYTELKDPISDVVNEVNTGDKLNSVIDCLGTEPESKSIRESPISDIEISEVDTIRTIKHFTENDLQIKCNNDCPIVEDNTMNNLKSVTDDDNDTSVGESKSTYVEESGLDDTYDRVSTVNNSSSVETISNNESNSIKGFDKKLLHSESSKDYPISEYDEQVNTNGNSQNLPKDVKNFTNYEVKSNLHTTSDLIVEVPAEDHAQSNETTQSLTNEHLTEFANLKECPIPASINEDFTNKDLASNKLLSEPKTSENDSPSSVSNFKNLAPIYELNSKNTVHLSKVTNVCDSNTEMPVDNIKDDKDCSFLSMNTQYESVNTIQPFTKTEIQTELINKDCPNFESSEISPEDNHSNFKDITNIITHSPLNISDGNVDNLTAVNDSINDELESQSNDTNTEVFINKDSDFEDKYDNNQVPEDIVTDDVLCSPNHESFDASVSNFTQSNNDESEILDEAVYHYDCLQSDSGIHDIETETSICNERVEETETSVCEERVEETETSICEEVEETDVLDEANAFSAQYSEKVLDVVKQTDELPEVLVASSTKDAPGRRCLKRSLSDSALNLYDNDKVDDSLHDIQLHNLITTKRRRKNNHFLNVCESNYSATDVLNFHNNRRNSICSVYNENMSFCIVIDDNCIITEENDEGEKICYTEIPEECLTAIHAENIDEADVDHTSEIILCPQESTDEYNETFVLEMSEEKTLEESWVDDVACVETVVSDDVAEDIELSAPSSPTEIDEKENDESDIFASVSDHTEKVKYIYGDKMCNDDAELVETLYRTPQMDVNKTLVNRESHITDDNDDDDDDYEENPVNNDDEFEPPNPNMLLHKSDSGNTLESNLVHYNNTLDNDLENINPTSELPETGHNIPTTRHDQTETNKSSTLCDVSQDNKINSCESSVDEVFSYTKDESSANSSAFSSPEVSSTTSEDRNTSTLLLKITNYQGTRTSQLNNMNFTKTNSCKFTENINYTNFISNSKEPRPLITKAAQKYIPPLKETVEDLKVKLPLSKERLMQFQQLKMSRIGKKHTSSPNKDIPKKIKPKFEDVLKSIDEIQFKMHKEKRKKPKKSVPKVVIKKNENGSHYASTNKECFNPDLTGRKWQPWVFIEKNAFIDKMALRRKTKAVFNHRKNTFVFADKFKKYKSIPSAKFVITQPKLDDSSVGKLKYTIRLKHSY